MTEKFTHLARSSLCDALVSKPESRNRRRPSFASAKSRR